MEGGGGVLVEWGWWGSGGVGFLGGERERGDQEVLVREESSYREIKLERGLDARRVMLTRR
jgi:hypothetical protein